MRMTGVIARGAGSGWDVTPGGATSAGRKGIGGIEVSTFLTMEAAAEAIDCAKEVCGEVSWTPTGRRGGVEGIGLEDGVTTFPPNFSAVSEAAELEGFGVKASE